MSIALALVLASALLPLAVESAERETHVPRYQPAHILQHAEGVVVLGPCTNDSEPASRYEATTVQRRLCVTRSSGNPTLDAAAQRASQTWISNPQLRERGPAREDIPEFLPPGCAQA